MKIAFFVSLFPRLSETFILNQITGLIDRGHDVDIYAYDNGKDPKVHAHAVEEQLHQMGCKPFVFDGDMSGTD